MIELKSSTKRLSLKLEYKYRYSVYRKYTLKCHRDWKQRNGKHESYNFCSEDHNENEEQKTKR